ncbi:Uncharacterized protein GBIM_09775 [Gryllus bimaculatus]|nr:Uncharacterized protein GBIM_09775 [Gryllus bimaculatus]
MAANAFRQAQVCGIVSSALPPRKKQMDTKVERGTNQQQQQQQQQQQYLAHMTRLTPTKFVPHNQFPIPPPPRRKLARWPLSCSGSPPPRWLARGRSGAGRRRARPVAGGIARAQHRRASRRAGRDVGYATRRPQPARQSSAGARSQHSGAEWQELCVDHAVAIDRLALLVSTVLAVGVHPRPSLRRRSLLVDAMGRRPAVPAGALATAVAVILCAGAASGALSCYKCTVLPPPHSSNETARLCSHFDGSARFQVDCPYSTFCLKRTFELPLGKGNMFRYEKSKVLNQNVFKILHVSFLPFDSGSAPALQPENLFANTK